MPDTKYEITPAAMLLQYLPAGYRGLDSELSIGHRNLALVSIEKQVSADERVRILRVRLGDEESAPFTIKGENVDITGRISVEKKTGIFSVQQYYGTRLVGTYKYSKTGNFESAERNSMLRDGTPDDLAGDILLLQLDKNPKVD